MSRNFGNFTPYELKFSGLAKRLGNIEVVAARILGHAFKAMSYGVYSGGVSLEVKREAMEKAIQL